MILAHAERYDSLQTDPDSVQAWLDAGAVLQVNVSSLAGVHGPEAQAAGEQLLRSRLAYVLASDGHPGMREDTLKRGHDLARQAGVSAVQAWQLTQANPRFLLEQGLPQLPATSSRSAAWRRARSAQIEAVRRIAARG
jgi:protein-tyrosine phosphatase